MRLARRPQHGMAQADRSFYPTVAGIRSPIGEKIHERLQQGRLNRRAVPVKNADNSAQSDTF